MIEAGADAPTECWLMLSVTHTYTSDKRTNFAESQIATEPTPKAASAGADAPTGTGSWLVLDQCSEEGERLSRSSGKGGSSNSVDELGLLREEVRGACVRCIFRRVMRETDACSNARAQRGSAYEHACGDFFVV